MDMDSLTGILAVVLALSMPVAIVAIVFYFRHKGRTEVQKTLRMAIEKGTDLPPEFLENLKNMQARKTPANDIRSGLILIAIALGLVALDLANHSFILGKLSGVAAIPGFIGVALLILGIIGNRKK
ncbi:DUF6249 domain-containing protein [Asticcacaulis taihuensis]|uniref:DUF6249 domain-containing protein n=2 Tax=Asticcacaulis TaxID=76890 RepID=A0A1G4PDS1_9CAUL|nr:DUF6249 domain-containing protein [Asticcacaulis taihuensis]SCW30453.1 hypothetical protein SAMN02927928_0288 [Asticcacaulis taihuensis]